MLVCNAFSLNMVFGFPVTVEVQEFANVQNVREYLANFRVESAVGHADTAALFSNLLGVEIPCERRTVSLRQSQSIVVGQYTGPRLPEGATTLPEGASVRWLLVTVGELTSPTLSMPL